jgi:hypothetical protein
MKGSFFMGTALAERGFSYQINTSREKESIGSDAFRIEYGNDVPEGVVYDDVVSYLGEYRFSLPKYSYNLKFKDGKLRDPNRNDSMEDLSQRAIDLKRKEGKPFVREQAELRGFQSLNDQLGFAKTGSTIIWASPPGPKEEGYGDYGFVYFGKVEENNSEEKNIKMTAMRVEKPSIAQFNKSARMFGDEKAEYSTAEEFLANPNVFSEDLEEGYADAILKKVFDFKPNEKEQEKFDQIIKKMFPLIWDFIGSSRSLRGLYSLENYALALKKDYEANERGSIVEIVDFRSPKAIRDIIRDYGHEPPKVAGSCGSTGSKNRIVSSNIFNALSSINSLSEGEWFTCPKCGYEADGPIGNECPGCGLTKDDYAEESGEPVCD